MAKNKANLVALICKECGKQTHVTKVSGKKKKVNLKKYCNQCQEHTEHKSTSKTK